MKGGRIEPFRDENDEFIGPARIWLKDEDIPGLAMSRSFGDMVAASVGCITLPGNFFMKCYFIIEIMEHDLTHEDKFFILASDGVWEFIESAEV